MTTVRAIGATQFLAPFSDSDSAKQGATRGWRAALMPPEKGLSSPSCLRLPSWETRRSWRRVAGRQCMNLMRNTVSGLKDKQQIKDDDDDARGRTTSHLLLQLNHSSRRLRSGSVRIDLDNLPFKSTALDPVIYLWISRQLSFVQQTSFLSLPRARFSSFRPAFRFARQVPLSASSSLCDLVHR